MPRRSISPEEEEKIASLYAEGRNSNQIAKELGLAYQTVHRRVQKFEAAEKQSGGDAQAEAQDAEAPVTQTPTDRKRKRRNGAVDVASKTLTHISTCEVYQGELLKFTHDRAGKTVSIELNGYEQICLSNDVFLMFARDIERMKTLLSDTNILE